MAVGMAIMGFGEGAMIGSPLAAELMVFFSTPSEVGVWQTFAVMGSLYIVVMLCGAFGYRMPATSWKPKGWTSLLPPGPQHGDYPWPRECEKGLGYHAVLAGVDGFDHERLGWYRCGWYGQPDAARNV